MLCYVSGHQNVSDSDADDDRSVISLLTRSDAGHGAVAPGESIISKNMHHPLEKGAIVFHIVLTAPHVLYGGFVPC